MGPMRRAAPLLPVDQGTSSAQAKATSASQLTGCVMGKPTAPTGQTNLRNSVAISLSKRRSVGTVKCFAIRGMSVFTRNGAAMAIRTVRMEAMKSIAVSKKLSLGSRGFIGNQNDFLKFIRLCFLLFLQKLKAKYIASFLTCNKLIRSSG